MVKLSPWPGDSCLFLDAFVPLKSVTTETTSTGASIALWAGLDHKVAEALKGSSHVERVTCGPLPLGTPFLSACTVT